MRLIGHYQAGRDPSPELAFRPGPLPKFDGASFPPTAVQPPTGPPPSAIQPQLSGTGPIRVPPLTPEKVNQYSTLFEKSGASNGVLAGEQAKNIFERAGLPNDILGRIWNLADTEQRGFLNNTEFVIAMHLIASSKAGVLRGLPSVLPPGLYEAAARRAPVRQVTGSGPSPIGPPPGSAIPRQFSGVVPQRTGSPLSRSGYGAAPQIPQPSGNGTSWDISPSDKAQFDKIYNGLDTANRGVITGDQAVPFFSESKLPEEILAQIWDLADINSEGHLNRDEFAVAMYLIRQQRNKREGRNSLPPSLPTNLVPPSMRNQVHPPTQPTAPQFDTSAPSMPKGAAEDLFGLDALASPTSAPAQVPITTGASSSFNNDPFGNNHSPVTSAAPISPQHTSSFKPFVPSSSFGQTLTYTATGGSNNAGPTTQARAIPSQASAVDDLLGDNDPEVSKRLTNETTELANLSNQVGSLTKQMTEVQGQRSSTEGELSQVSTQKRDFEQRLSQLRAMYDHEVKELKGLQERLTVSRNDNRKLQQDIAMLDGTYQDLQTQHGQASTALQADQQENASLKERMRTVNAEITQMKPQLERLKLEARQQKGLVAINKKQLATNESERDKIKAESAELTRSNEEQARAIAASSRAQSPVANVASPAASTKSATNPFFRRQTSVSGSPTSPYVQSPAPNQQPERSSDNIFGPAFGHVPNLAPMPATSSRQEGSSEDAPSSLPDRTVDDTQSPASYNEQNSEVHAPPESRQISSSFLPFTVHHIDSLSSSRQVSAPTSRFGEDSDGVNTPTRDIQHTPTGSSMAEPETIGDDPTYSAPPTLDSGLTASPAATEHDAIPGAFPGDPNSHMVATPTGDSTRSGQGSLTNHSDPFALRQEHTGSATSTRDDFDSAFAGFGGPTKLQERQNTGSSFGDAVTGAPQTTSKEFPPIAELDHDDDSDSASERGGFDDDFAAPSPHHSREVSSVQELDIPQSGAGTSSSLGNSFATSPGPDVAHIETAREAEPPAVTAQMSPPAYDHAASPAAQHHDGVEQYAGLIPTREDPTSPSAENQPHSVPSTSAHNVPNNAPLHASQPAPPAKVPFDDDSEDEFDGLEDAKEGDDDDFANISTHDRSGVDDFNPMFDSPEPSKGSGHMTNDSNGFNGNLGSFSPFDSSPARGPQSQTTLSSKTQDNHDWDAIFSGLDGPSGVDASTVTHLSPTQATFEPTSSNNGGGLAPGAKERPQLGRALTAGTEHDDPILKNLTSMGYGRDQALAALEKYDYNLQKV